MQAMIALPPTTTYPLKATEILRSLVDCQRLIASGQLQEAAALTWSAFEAAVRLSLTELGQQTDDPIWISDTPYGLSAQAVAYGIIDPEDRDVILRFLFIHDVARGSAEDIDTSLLQEVSRFTERTLDEMEQQ